MIAWLFCLVSVGLFPLARADSLPTFGEVKAAYSISEGQLLDRKGRLLQEMRLDWSARIYPWVPLERVAPSLIYAILDLEDKKFEDHGGVDAMAVAAAVWQNLVHGTRRGASTISMQTVSLVEDAGKLRKGRRSLWAKLRQARLALELEKKWTKREILEAYLNLVGFRGELRGLAAAARTLFGKDPHGLDFRESYLLGVLLRSPGMGAKSASERLCRLAAVRKELGSCTEIEAFVLSSLSHWNGRALRVSHAPHLARRLLSAERKELRSTIDMRVQMHAAKAVRDQLLNLNQQNVGDAAVIVVDNRSGQDRKSTRLNSSH